MTGKRIHYPRTTGQQRKRLFELWEETGNKSDACRKAHIGRRTFCYWKPRFEAGGYEALEKYESAGPTPGSRIPIEVHDKVIELKEAHSKWGRRRIADEIAKENNWVPLVSPSSVRRILEQAVTVHSQHYPISVIQTIIAYTTVVATIWVELHQK